ncbi:glycosyltransferase family 2 protein [uncultured Clostridium sp.]|uniref:glycosyltransferase family 2 protein n=1 Tax=uncultured Clostridium sp. TaxID=59620 RepID=UPI0025EC1544|nr:glycosyltransferase family 2 protein [uncultured Clostridium sp.]
MKKLISIVAPMYNEEVLCHQYCKETLAMTRSLEDKYDFEIILVNDGSKDNTYAIMLEEQKANPKEITTICLSRNFGLEGAVNAGIRKAMGDAVVVMDSDLQDPPVLIPEMIKKWEAGADIVVGSRVKRSNDNFLKKAGANFYYKVLDSLSGKLKLEKSAANFRLLSRKALNQVLDLPEVNSVFRVVVPFVGMKTDIIEYDRDKRFAGKTKYNLKSMIPYALDSITGISVEPLRKVMYFIPITGMIIFSSLIALILAEGVWKAICLVLLIMSLLFEMVFLSLYVMSEYIAQIMTEIKGRPISIIYDYKESENARRRIE